MTTCGDSFESTSHFREPNDMEQAMSRRTEDTFPYEAIAELSSLCHEDHRITKRMANDTIVAIYREHADRIGERFGVPADVIARFTAHIAGTDTEFGTRLMQAAGDPDNDFAATSARMGYAKMVRATTVHADEPRLEIGLARDGRSVDRRWIVVEHSGCDPERPDRGCSGLDDFADFGEALAAYEAAVLENQRAIGMKL